MNWKAAMKIKDIIRLLILNESQNETEEIINLFRNNGFPTRGERVVSQQQLEQLLEEQEPWDLLVGDDSKTELKMVQALKAVAAIKADIPVIWLSSENTPCLDEALDAGAQDLIAKNNTGHLLHAALREISNRRARLESSTIRGTLEELQARYELLMDGSQDAIAYITDGMHVDVNDAYATRFGYEDAEEMACMPVVDLIAGQQQEAFKTFLRDYSKTRANNAELETCGLAKDGTELVLHMIFSPASYEGEDCTQIVIRAGNTVSAPGRDFRQGFADLAQQVVQLRNNKIQATLVYLQLQNMVELRSTVGLLAADKAVSQLKEFLGKSCDTATLCTPVCHDGYVMLLPDTGPEPAQKLIDELVTSTRQHIIEVGSISVHCELVAAVMPINHKAAEPAETLIGQAYTGVCELVERSDDCQCTIYCPPAAPIKLGSKDIDLDELYEEGRLKLLYQPIVSLRGEPGEHYEVTASLEDTDGSPIEVRHLAAGMYDDKQGSIFDRWVIFSATRLLAQKRNPSQNDTRLIINLSSACLRDHALASWLETSLNAAGLPAQALGFQLETTEAETSLKLSERFFVALKKLGCTCSLRDYDLARDSSKVMEHIAPQMIKISPEIVERAQTDDKGRHLLKQVLNEASQNSAATIVPSVATAATLATLWQLGAAFIQGSYLQDPAPEMEYEFSEIA
jgi:PAS domain S-box-containing protein